MDKIMNAMSPASGHGRFWKRSAKIIRFARKGCTNRPFFQIVVMERRKAQNQPVIEQVGTYDPIANKYNQQMISLNYERIRHWLGCGAFVSRPVSQLLGISGFLPVYPKTYMDAWRNRKTMREKAAAEQLKEAEPAP